MTVSSLTTSVSYAGNASATLFPVTFPFFEITVEEIILGVVTALAEGCDYTVTGGAGSTGTVTISPAPASGVTIRIRRTTDRRQLTDYVANDPFPAQTHEKALDRMAMAVQELAVALDVDDDDEINEALSAPVTGGAWDADSRKIENVADGTASGDAVNKSQLDAAILDANGIVNSDNITEGAVNKFDRAAYAEDYGAVGDYDQSDGSGTDDSDAINAALAASNYVYLDPNKAYLINQTVVVPPYKTLDGQGNGMAGLVGDDDAWELATGAILVPRNLARVHTVTAMITACDHWGGTR